MNQDALDYRRVERAIRFLEEHRAEQPELDEVAAQVGLSPHHFHRLFQRWAGTTPKRFLEHLTVEHARTLLEQSRTVLETAYRSGLSGGSRLHDHFVRVEAATPGEVKSGGEGLRIRTGVHATPFGEAFLAATDRGICFLSFLPDEEQARLDAPGEPVREPERGNVSAAAVGATAAARAELRVLWPEAAVEEDPAATGALVRRAFSILDERESGDFERLPLHLRGTNFQLQVWRALLRIPPGRIASYGILSRIVGHPSAARAVGSAIGANPISFLIPCHRVIRSSGRIGEYRWGAPRKRAMLGWEAARTERWTR